MTSGTLNTRNLTQHAFGNSTAATVIMVPAFDGRDPNFPNMRTRASIFALIVTVAEAETVTVQDTTGMALSQAFDLVANGSIVLDPMQNGDYWWQSAPGAGLQLLQSVAGTALGYDVWWAPSI